MEIAIFGDSFADDKFSNLDEKSWIDFLRDSGIEVHNFSLSGTSLMWSYKKYLDLIKTKLNRKIDKIIFIITASNRITAKYKDKTINVTNANSFDSFIIHTPELDNEDVEIINSFKNYFLYFHNEEESDIIANLIKKDILLDNRTIYLEPFSTDLPKNQISLWDISRTELKIMFKDPRFDGYEFMNTHSDNRKCHMSEPNNMMVGKKFLQAISWGNRTIEIFSDDFMQPLDRVDRYFIPRNHG